MLPVERFAELRAKIERSGDRDQVLRGAGISPREWMHLQRRWLGELAGEAALGRTALAEKYRRAFEAGAEAAPEAASAGSVAQPGSRPAEAPFVMPSYMVGARPPPEASPSPPAPVPPAAAAPAPSPPPHRRGATLQGNSGLRGPATPFRAGPPSSEVAQPSPRKDLPAPGGVGTGTSLVVDIPRALVTPFQKLAETAKADAPRASPGAPATQAAPPPAASAPVAGGPAAAKPVPAPPVNTAPASLTGTAIASPLAAIAAAMPFKAKAPVAAQPSSPSPPQAGAPTSPSSSAPPQAGAPASPSSPPAPQAGATPLPELTVEQYAWLVAALRRTRGPAEVEQAFRALRLSPDVQKPLEERWRARMAADPALQQRFLAALATQLSGAAR